MGFWEKFRRKPRQGEIGPVEISREQTMRRLALNAYWEGLKSEKPEDSIVISIPPELGVGEINAWDTRQMADAIHGYRFPGEEMQNTQEAREAAINYYAALIVKKDGLSQVRLFFSEKAYRLFHKEIENHQIEKELNILGRLSPN